VSREALTELAENSEPRFTRRDEQVTYQFSTEILRDHFVSDETFAAGLDELGEQGLVDLIGSLGKSYRPGSSTLRQVTQPSSFSNSLMSTTTGVKPRSSSSSAVRGADAAISTRSPPSGTT
jgi:hypothetical protein